jgi:hypothetical protein
MRRTRLVVAVALGGAVLASAAVAKDVLSGLESYGFKHGKIVARGKNGGIILEAAGGAGEALRIGPQTTYLRVERVQRDALRSGDQVLTRDGKEPASVVVVFDKESDVDALIDMLGPAARRQAEAEKGAIK